MEVNEEQCSLDGALWRDGISDPVMNTIGGMESLVTPEECVRRWTRPHCGLTQNPAEDYNYGGRSARRTILSPRLHAPIASI